MLRVYDPQRTYESSQLNYLKSATSPSTAPEPHIIPFGSCNSDGPTEVLKMQATGC
ncbi:hypothetical protein Hanom_Chr14g01274531 [Helianthus anomalus]